ncbi:MAG: PP2C family protein-serine/threonine phosphatase [Anaerolineales bacterium]
MDGNLPIMLIHEEALKRVPLFQALPDSELRELAGGLQLSELDQGELMFSEGDRGNQCYIVVEGQVEIIKSLGTEEERLLAIRDSGEAIGEMSLFSEDHQRTASVRAKTPLKLLVIERNDLEAVLRRQPDLAFGLVATLSRRLEESENLTISDLREKNRQLRQAFDELKAAQAQIVEKERLERELEVARDIQISILPRELPDDSNWEFGAHFSSMEAVGGDFYDVIELGDGRLGLAMGDVSGHGVPAALFMSLTATLIKAEAKRSESPGDVLRAVNSQLIETSDSGMFVTVLYGILDSVTRSFGYARAGHSTPLIANPGEPARQLEDGLGQLLGVFEDMVLDEANLTMPSNGMMLLYTDGVTEAANEREEFFGEEGLLEAVDSDEDRQPDAVCQRIWEAVQAFQGAASNEDDITLLAIRAN